MLISEIVCLHAYMYMGHIQVNMSTRFYSYFSVASCARSPLRWSPTYAPLHSLEPVIAPPSHPGYVRVWVGKKCNIKNIWTISVQRHWNARKTSETPHYPSYLPGAGTYPNCWTRPVRLDRLREGVHVQGKREPKRKCWTTGNLPSTSFSYIVTRPAFALYTYIDT